MMQIQYALFARIEYIPSKIAQWITLFHIVEVERPLKKTANCRIGLVMRSRMQLSSRTCSNKTSGTIRVDRTVALKVIFRDKLPRHKLSSDIVTSSESLKLPTDLTSSRLNSKMKVAERRGADQAGHLVTA